MGDQKQLGQHVGERVRITGSLTERLTPGTAAPNNPFNVTGVTKMSGICRNNPNMQQ